MTSDGFDIEVEGLSDLKAILEDIGTKQADRCIRKALNAGGNLMKEAIEEAAPVKAEDEKGGQLPPGALKSDFSVKLKQSDQGNWFARIAPGKMTAHVAMWVEYGHRLIHKGKSRLIKTGKHAGKTKGPGKQVGTVRAYQFIRPAYEATAAQASDLICKTLAKEVTAAAARGKK